MPDPGSAAAPQPQRLTRGKGLPKNQPVALSAKRTARNAAWVLGERIILLFSGILIGSLVIRHLGPVGYGTYALAASLMTIFTSIATFGTNQLIVKDIVSRPEDLYRIAGSSLVVRAIVALVSSSLMLTYAFGAGHMNSHVSWSIALASIPVLLSAAHLPAFYYQARLREGVVSVYRLSGTALMYGAQIFLIASHRMNPALFVVATVVQPAVWIALTWRRFSREVGRLTFGVDWGKVKAYALQGGTLAVSGLATVAYLRLDQVMLAEMLGTGETGVYASAAKLSEGIYFLPLILSNSALPRLTQAFGTVQHSSEDERVTQALFDVITWSAIPIAFVVMLLAPRIVHLLFGAAFSSASSVLTIHVWALIFYGWVVARDRVAISQGAVRSVATANLLGLGANIGLNFLLIPTMGILGAAISTVTSYGVASLLSSLLVTDLRSAGLSMARSLFRPHRALLVGLRVVRSW